jgi:predicted RNA-binding protein with RPS1 domain
VPTARSSRSRAASKASSTSPSSPGPSASRSRPSILKVGQEVDAVILNIQQGGAEDLLGIRQLETNPWEKVRHNYPVGARVRGKVRNLTNYGAFVELEDGIDGMVHVSDMSWTRRINNPAEVMKKGDDVEAIVLDVDVDQQRISLGVKQTQTDPWSEIDRKFRIGDLVNGKVSKIANFGAFIELSDEIDGLGARLPARRTARRERQGRRQGRPGRHRPRHQDRQGGPSHRPLDQGRELRRRTPGGRDLQLRAHQGPVHRRRPGALGRRFVLVLLGRGDFNSLGDLLDKAGN